MLVKVLGRRLFYGLSGSFPAYGAGFVRFHQNYGVDYAEMPIIGIFVVVESIRWAKN